MLIQEILNLLPTFRDGAAAPATTTLGGDRIAEATAAAQALVGEGGERIVEQHIDRDRRARFRRETIEVPLESGALVLVRKRAARPHAPRRGAVLLCHGFTQNRYSWHVERRSLACYLAHEGFDVFNFDLRGAGRSRLRGAPPSRGFHDHVEGDLPRAIEAALAASGERDLFLVGHSMGGAIACAVAGLLPDKVRGVVSIAGLYGFAARNRLLRALGNACGLLEARFAARPFLPESLPLQVVGRFLDATHALWDHPLSLLLPLSAWAPGSIEPEVLHDWVRRAFEPASRELILALARLARGGDFADAQGRGYFPAFEARRDVPLLVLTGGADALIAPEDACRAHERSRAADRTCLVLDGTQGGASFGHMDVILGRDAPSQVWPVLRGWMAAR